MPSPRPPATTFAPVLAGLVAAAPGRPLVTAYDEASGERVELSRTTTANWVAKVAGLLADELGLERGQRLRVDLPPHWLGPVFWSAAWIVGLVVCDDEEPDAVVCGPTTLARWAPAADRLTVLACSLRPMGVRFAEPVPPGVHDVGIEVWSQPDAFTAYDAPSGEDLALDIAGHPVTQAELWSGAAAGSLLADGGRLLVAADPASPPAPATWAELLLRSGSLVLVSHADPARLEAISVAEQVTDRFPRVDQPPPQPTRS